MPDRVSTRDDGVADAMVIRADDALHGPPRSDEPAPLLQLLADPACLIDRDANVLHANDAWAELLDKRCAGAPEYSLFESIQDEDHRGFQGALEELRSGNAVRDAAHWFRTASGRTCCLQWSGMPLSGHAMACIVARDMTEDRRRIDQLQATAEFNQRLLHNSQVCIKVLDTDGRLLSMTPIGRVLLQIPDGLDVAGRRWPDFWQGEERVMAEKAVADALAGRSTRFSGYCATMTGVPKWWDIAVSPIHDGNGIQRLLVVSHDITRQKENEEIIRRNKDQFQILTELLPQIVWMADAAGHLNYVNPRWHALTGFDEACTLGMGWLDAIKPSHRERVRAAWHAACRDLSDYEAEAPLLHAADGTYHWHLSRARPMRDDAGEVVMWVGSHTDIHDIKESEAALRLSEIRYRSLVTSSAGIVWSCTPGLDIPLPAPSWEHYTGQSFEHYRNAGWRQAIHADDIEELDDLWSASMQHLRLLEFRCRLKRHDGSWRVNLLRGVPVLDASGAILEWVCTAVDIHDRSEAQRQLEIAMASERAARAEAERIGRVKDEFLTTLSHELRTPLNAILGWSQILQRKVDDTEAVARGIAVIDRNVRVQTRLIEDLLDLSGIISGKIRLDRKPVPIDEVLQAAIESVTPSAVAKNIRIAKDLIASSRLILADVGRLQQVFWNLLTNAIKFTPPGGFIRIAVTHDERIVTARIADDGEGIPPEFLPRIFERFTQGDASIKRRHGGLGVGLSIVRTLTEMHGGSVSAESEGAGRGATFYVKLPLLATPPDGAQQNTLSSYGVEDASALEGKRILVIDDEADARELLERLLEECGAVTRQAASAADAYAEIERFQPDLILCDIGMPMVDGYQFIRNLRQRGVSTPAAALTAFAREEDRTRSLEAGFQTHLTKPVEASILFHTIANLSQVH